MGHRHFAYVHAGQDPQQAFDTGASWGTWHTTAIEWTPKRLSFFLDGKLIGTTTQGVPMCRWTGSSRTSPR